MLVPSGSRRRMQVCGRSSCGAGSITMAEIIFPEGHQDGALCRNRSLLRASSTYCPSDSMNPWACLRPEVLLEVRSVAVP